MLGEAGKELSRANHGKRGRGASAEGIRSYVHGQWSEPSSRCTRQHCQVASTSSRILSRSSSSLRFPRLASWTSPPRSMGFTYAKEVVEDLQAPVASTSRPKPRLPDLPPIDLDDEPSPPPRTNGKSKAGQRKADVIVLDDEDEDDDEEMEMEEVEPARTSRQAEAAQLHHVEGDNEEDEEQLAKVSLLLLLGCAPRTDPFALSSTSSSPASTSRSTPSANFAPPSSLTAQRSRTESKLAARPPSPPSRPNRKLQQRAPSTTPRATSPGRRSSERR